MRGVVKISAAALILCLALYAIVQVWKGVTAGGAAMLELSTNLDPLPPLDAQGVPGMREVTKAELLKRMTRLRPLAPMEKSNLDRGCPGLVCLYQGLGLTRWPESAPGTRAYLRLEDALNRSCPGGRKNFIFLKQAWWTSGSPPTPEPATGEVPLSSVTRAKPGWYTFNYAVYFPTTQTYAWINHREYGFPANLLWPMKAYVSPSSPAIDETRPAQIYCSTCK